MTWSSLDLAGHCRADLDRTAAFDAALAQVVKRGDTVLDVGAGTGILSALALKYGASRVTAVERDPMVCAYLQQGVNETRLPIDVVCGNAIDLTLPPTDLLIAEMVDVWLLEEDYANVVGTLLEKRTIVEDTRIVPCGYVFDITFGELNWDSSDLLIRWPHYEWPYYDVGHWGKPTFKPIAEFKGFYSVDAHDFRSPRCRVIDYFLPIEQHAAEALVYSTGVRLSGTLIVGGTVQVGRCGSMNAPLLLPVHLASANDWKRGVRIAATLSGGIQSLCIVAGEQPLLTTVTAT